MGRTEKNSSLMEMSQESLASFPAVLNMYAH